MRAGQPDRQDVVDRNEVKVWFEVYAWQRALLLHLSPIWAKRSRPIAVFFRIAGGFDRCSTRGGLLTRYEARRRIDIRELPYIAGPQPAYWA